MISLLVPPGGSQLGMATRLLTDELGTASNIKKTKNRNSVIDALKVILQRLKGMKAVPSNGIALFAGTVIAGTHKEKLQLTVLEPPAPISRRLYRCDKRFHAEELEGLMRSEDDESFGFIVMDGAGCLFGTVAGAHRRTLGAMTVSLPRKHNKGGQSQNRFMHLREEARHNYVSKVAEEAVRHFITDDVCNVSGIILAGHSDFKNVLQKGSQLDKRLGAAVVSVVDVAYGGKSGFSEAITRAAPLLARTRVGRDSEVLDRLFESMAKDDGLYCLGVREVMDALEIGAVETLIVYDGLEVERVEVADRLEEGEVTVHYTNAKSDPLDDVVKSEALLDYLVEEARGGGGVFGAALRVVGAQTSQGTQLAVGLGGIAAILRFPMATTEALTDSTFDESHSDLEGSDSGEDVWGL